MINYSIKDVIIYSFDIYSWTLAPRRKGFDAQILTGHSKISITERIVTWHLIFPGQAIVLVADICLSHHLFQIAAV